MKDDLTNKIVGSIRAHEGFPLVVKVNIPFFSLNRLSNLLSLL